jgi:hypothetical protein
LEWANARWGVPLGKALFPRSSLVGIYRFVRMWPAKCTGQRESAQTQDKRTSIVVFMKEIPPIFFFFLMRSLIEVYALRKNISIISLQRILVNMVRFGINRKVHVAYLTVL